MVSHCKQLEKNSLATNKEFFLLFLSKIKKCQNYSAQNYMSAGLFFKTVFPLTPVTEEPLDLVTVFGHDDPEQCIVICDFSQGFDVEKTCAKQVRIHSKSIRVKLFFCFNSFFIYQRVADFLFLRNNYQWPANCWVSGNVLHIIPKSKNSKENKKRSCFFFLSGEVGLFAFVHKKGFSEKGPKLLFLGSVFFLDCLGICLKFFTTRKFEVSHFFFFFFFFFHVCPFQLSQFQLLMHPFFTHRSCLLFYFVSSFQFSFHLILKFSFFFVKTCFCLLRTFLFLQVKSLFSCIIVNHWVHRILFFFSKHTNFLKKTHHQKFVLSK